MKNVCFVILLIQTMGYPSIAYAEKPKAHLQLSIHAKKTNIQNTIFGFASVIESPKISKNPDVWIALIGPRLDGHGWYLEAMSGAIINHGIGIPILDIRFELNPKMIKIPLYIWGNPRVILGEDSNTFYGFLQINYVLPYKIAFIGIETENLIQSNIKDCSVGPQLVIPLKHMHLVTSYQFHTLEKNQFWFRALIHL